MKTIIVALCFILTPILALSTTPSTQTSAPNIGVSGINTHTGPAREDQWNALVGTWFGSSESADGKHMWISEKKYDGTYKTRFRTIYPSGKTRDKVEVGKWGVSGNVYFTIYEADIIEGRAIPADITDPRNRDAYRILKLTDDVFEYEHLDSGVRYTAKKVPADLVFPDK